MMAEQDDHRRDLPPEILLQIFSPLVHSSGDLLSFSLVCRSWTGSALSTLYRDISMDWTPSRATLLRQALKSNPTLARSILSFSITGISDSDLRKDIAASFLKSEEWAELLRKGGIRPVRRDVAYKTSAKLPLRNLRNKRIDDLHRCDSWLREGQLIAMVSVLRQLLNLRHFGLNKMSIPTHQYWTTSATVPWTQAKSVLQSLPSLSLNNVGSTLSDILFSKLANLESLEVRDCDGNFPRIPRLRHIVTNSRLQDFDSLDSLAKSLRTLDLTLQLRCMVTNFNTIPIFPRVTYLRLNFGDRAEKWVEEDSYRRFWAVLPSLRHVTLLCPDDLSLALSLLPITIETFEVKITQAKDLQEEVSIAVSDTLHLTQLRLFRLISNDLDIPVEGFVKEVEEMERRGGRLVVGTDRLDPFGSPRRMIKLWKAGEHPRE